ncbi:PIN domain-containing protein [Hymenobacter coccineus]|uniref:PIN domain-containing protein n=1 Tax=Hymenobacter coccineus TaxID=1908235 RepID=A0A1G1TH27_9BACT|nr:PIN domain-containing protein [Hymenobacter coccineus]OGX90178.1 PIN domain-containing protein [Hymenobacter coccineus]
MAASIALLDACVLYPVPLRDLLLQLAAADLYQPKWTPQIQEEWSRNLLVNRPDLTAAQLQRTIALMEQAFPDAQVTAYKALIPTLTLPDANDRHVLAAALRSQARVIVTANLKDFPAPYLATLGIERQHPDAFISQLLDHYPTQALEAFRQQVAYLKKPPKTALEVLGSLRTSGLLTTADRLQALL